MYGKPVGAGQFSGLTGYLSGKNVDVSAAKKKKNGRFSET